ncbi:ABC-three component system protein [Photobacterium carnosum]|uniref:ABC-three component systems C-terminal domain-containing protein n=1 Tax=Photobacterium carnosum TaxID=2023717 RepID=A0A2N4UQS3_9GAMM|nr:ABC-three component system protein [Photobacterium carnosum]PLC57361.1 hypothetical protein CIK00_13805 [Photobacterium carnosum]
MTDALSKIKNVSYVVNDGSGVLLQAMTTDYSYVVTAKHVIQVDKNNSEQGILSISDISVFSPDDIKIRVLDTFIHPTLDLAILTIEYINSDIPLSTLKCQRNENLVIYGYPNYSGRHRNTQLSRRLWLETYNLNFLDINDNIMTMGVPDVVQLSDMEGFSGCGVFHINNGKPFLVGIDFAFDKPGEYVSRILSVSIENIFTILNLNNLPQINPPYFKNIFELKEDIFKYDNCFSIEDIKKATGVIKGNSDYLQGSCEITPFNILTHHNDILDFIGCSSSDKQNEKIWIAFLEFLYVNNLLERKEIWDCDLIEYLKSNFKLIYINSDKGYKHHLHNILSANVEHLKEKGKLLIIDFGQMPPKPDTLNLYRDKIPNNVANAIDEESITNALYIMKKSISIIHLPKLHEHCIVDKELQFEQLNRITDREKILKIIRDGYLEFLSMEDIVCG